MVISLGITTPNDTTTVDGLGRAPVSQYRLFANVPQQHPTALESIADVDSVYWFDEQV